MAETKRVSDQYKISSPSIVIDGNLTVTGSTTSVETINSTIKDNIIRLNEGELGAGISLVTSGIEIDRGSEVDASLLFDETTGTWTVKVGSNLANIRVAEPASGSDAVTKNYVDTSVVNPGGIEGSVQFNQSNNFGGSANFLWNGTNLSIYNLQLASSSITTTGTNNDLTLSANGSGKIFLQNPLRLENEISDPGAISGSNMFYAKTPGNAGSGLFFVNTNDSDELVSRKKAILFGLIF